VHVNPLRCARGTFDLISTVNFGAIGLFNNDTTKLIRVLDFVWFGTVIFGSFVSKTRLTSHAGGTIVPVVTDEPIPPGIIDSQDLAAFPTIDYSPAFVNVAAYENSLWHGHAYPFAVLKPGWTFALVDSTTGQAPEASFFWDWVWPDELLNGDIGDPYIDRRVRP
jgi:hypothetical protein